MGESREGSLPDTLPVDDRIAAFEPNPRDLNERRDHRGSFLRRFRDKPQVYDTARRGEASAVDELSIIPVKGDENLVFPRGAVQDGDVLRAKRDLGDGDDRMPSFPQLAHTGQ